MPHTKMPIKQSTLYCVNKILPCHVKVSLIFLMSIHHNALARSGALPFHPSRPSLAGGLCFLAAVTLRYKKKQKQKKEEREKKGSAGKNPHYFQKGSPDETLSCPGARTAILLLACSGLGSNSVRV
jgi:hypothetical protein